LNLPNRLTVIRLFLAPLFFIIFFLPLWVNSGDASGIMSVSGWLLVLLYIGIELTDLLDGIIARKRNLITDLGKVLDPFADVISRVTYFFCLAFTGIMPLWVLLIIVYRELSITFLRMVLMGRGTVMAASIWGKTKAVLYAVSGIGGLLYVLAERVSLEYSWEGVFFDILQVVYILTAVASVLSFIAYLQNARKSGAFSSMSR